MRILIHSENPLSPTGYAQQTAVWAPRLASLGHEVIISAYSGIRGATVAWNGITILPPGQDSHGSDILRAHAAYVKADLVITLMDAWALTPGALKGLPAACWMPVDCDRLSVRDRKFLEESGAVPVAMSRFGKRILTAAGFDPLYVPHGIPTDVFTPPQDRDALRARLGLDGKFTVGVNAANHDKTRKGFFEQLAAFAQFHARHPEAVMLLHTAANAPGALDLDAIVAYLGIREAVKFTDQYGYISGHADRAGLAAWYGALDVLSNCAYGEGFGLPIIEAQACATPVVVTDCSAMSELCGAGWKVSGEPYWHDAHQAQWTRPSIAGITRAYEKAYEYAGRKREQARQFAMTYDADRVLREYWVPVLHTLGAHTKDQAA